MEQQKKTPDWILDGYDTEEEYVEAIRNIEADEQIAYMFKLIESLDSEYRVDILDFFHFLLSRDELEKDIILSILVDKMDKESFLEQL